MLQSEAIVLALDKRLAIARSLLRSRAPARLLRLARALGSHR